MKKAKGFIVLLAITITQAIIAQNNSGGAPSSQQVLSLMQSEKTTWFAIINLAIEIILFAGVIYIAISMLSKQQTNKNILVSWIVILIIWGFANLLLV